MEHGPLKLEAGIEQAAGQDADEQGGVDLLRDQGKPDGNHRGQQGPGGGVERADILRGLLARREGARGHGQNSHDQHCQKRQPVSFLSHFFSLHCTAWARTAQFRANKKTMNADAPMAKPDAPSVRKSAGRRPLDSAPQFVTVREMLSHSRPGRRRYLRRCSLSCEAAAWPCSAVRMNTAPLSSIYLS